MPDDYDVIIIGGGASGENVAGRTAPGGLSTVIIESDLVGGECSFWACIPSKALLRPGEVLSIARRVPAAEVAVTGGPDVKRTLRSRDALVGNWDDSGQVRWVESVGADLIRGRARLAGERRVEVDTGDEKRTLTARKAVVLAIGSRPVLPPIAGLEDIRPWTSRDATSVKAVPSSLIVLGAGPVGLEMAQAFHWLGTEVTLIERGTASSNPRIEPFAMQTLIDTFRDLGIRVLMGTTVTSVTRSNGKVTATLEDGSEMSAAEMAVATGRAPATHDLGFESVGLEAGKPVRVNDHLQVDGVEGGWLYAVGDVNGRALLTHQAKYQARAAGDYILGRNVSAWADHAAVPSVIFTDPQIASVGLTEQLAQDRRMNIRAVQLDWVVAASSLAGTETQGGAKFVVDEDRQVLVGATFVGPGVGEMLHAATIAIVGEVPLERLWHAVPPFPTLSEIWLRFLEAYGL